MTSRWLVRRTLATLRSAEFGFFGVVVYTRVQTPRCCGFCSIAGTFDLAFCGSRPLRTSWLIVGMKPFTFALPEIWRLLCREPLEKTKRVVGRVSGHLMTRVLRQRSALPTRQRAGEAGAPIDSATNAVNRAGGFTRR